MMYSEDEINKMPLEIAEEALRKCREVMPLFVGRLYPEITLERTSMLQSRIHKLKSEK